MVLHTNLPCYGLAHRGKNPTDHKDNWNVWIWVAACRWNIIQHRSIYICNKAAQNCIKCIGFSRDISPVHNGGKFLSLLGSADKINLNQAKGMQQVQCGALGPVYIRRMAYMCAMDCPLAPATVYHVT